MRKTISVKHPTINQYTNKLNSTDRDRLMRRLMADPLLAVFEIDGNTTRFINAYGWCDHCHNAPGIHDGYRVDMAGKWICDDCQLKFWSDGSLFVSATPTRTEVAMPISGA